jgi:hypothetical protein
MLEFNNQIVDNLRNYKGTKTAIFTFRWSELMINNYEVRTLFSWSVRNIIRETTLIWTKM